MVESSDLNKTCRDYLSDDYPQQQYFIFDLRGQLWTRRSKWNFWISKKLIKNHQTFQSLINHDNFSKIICDLQGQFSKLTATNVKLRSYEQLLFLFRFTAVSMMGEWHFSHSLWNNILWPHSQKSKFWLLTLFLWVWFSIVFWGGGGLGCQSFNYGYRGTKQFIKIVLESSH